MNNTEQTSAEVSATEWLRKEKDKARIGPAEDWIMWALGLAEQLAQRCDGAERKVALGDDVLHRHLGSMRAQLAAAQSEALANDSDSIVASCNCLTKTNEAKYHKRGCKFRLIEERDTAQSEAASLRVSWQNAEQRGTEYRAVLDELLSCLKLIDGRQTGFSATALRVHVGHAITVLDRHNPQQP